MDPELHDLTAPYALDALDEDERAQYERHLATCERCREDLAVLQDTTAQLAYGVASPTPPAHLRDRVLESVRADGGVVVEFPRRRLTYALGAAAAAAAALAVGFAAWSASLRNDLEAQRSVVDILADPDARIHALDGANGRLVVTETGEAALVVAGLPRAPEGKTYEAWVIAGDEPQPAGLFDGKAARDVVLLSRPVPPQASVAVTIEPAGGSQAPTSTPIFSTRT